MPLGVSPLLGAIFYACVAALAYGMADIARVHAEGRGERSRLQLLLKVAGAENMLILAVNGLAVDGALTTFL